MPILKCKPGLDKIDKDQAERMMSIVEGRIVHYVAYNSRHLAAIIIGVCPADVDDAPDHPVDIALFTNLKNVNGDKNFGLQFHSEVRYSPLCKPGTWHWIGHQGLDAPAALGA